MDWLLTVAQFVVNEILSVPAFLIGIITAVGLVALRRPVGQVVGSALKATLGFLLIGAGATLVEGWAFKKFYNSESARLAALPAWVHEYNHHRPHSAIGKAAPITRLNNLAGHHT